MSLIYGLDSAVPPAFPLPSARRTGASHVRYDTNLCSFLGTTCCMSMPVSRIETQTAGATDPALGSLQGFVWQYE